jgi:hypothetical protein
MPRFTKRARQVWMNINNPTMSKIPITQNDFQTKTWLLMHAAYYQTHGV